MTETTTLSLTVTDDWRESSAEGLTEVEVLSYRPGSVTHVYVRQAYDDSWGGISQDLIAANLQKITPAPGSNSQPVTTGTITVGTSLTQLKIVPDRSLVFELGLVKIEQSTRFNQPSGASSGPPPGSTPGDLGSDWRDGYDAFRDPPEGSWGPSSDDPPGLRPIDGVFGSGNKLTLIHNRVTTHDADTLQGFGWSAATFTFNPNQSISIATSGGHHWSSQIDNSFTANERLLLIEADPDQDKGLFVLEASGIAGVNQGTATITSLSNWAIQLTKIASHSGSSGGGSNSTTANQYDVSITGSSAMTNIGQLTRADQTIEWGSFSRYGRLDGSKLTRLIDYVTRRIELEGHSAWNDTYTVAIDTDGVITETITGSGYDHTDIVLDRVKTVSTSLFETGSASSMPVLIQWDIDEGPDGRGAMSHGGNPGSGGNQSGSGGGSGSGSGSGSSGGSGSGGSSGSGGEPGASGSGEGHLRLGSNDRFTELGAGWIHTTYVTNLLFTHTPLPEEENSGGGSGGDGGSGGGGGDGSGSSSGDPNVSLVPRFDSLLTGSVQTHTTSSFISTIDDAFAQLVGQSSGRGENGAMNYDYYHLFELSLDELLAESAASSSIDRTVTFNADRSIDLTFSGTRTRNRNWSNKYTIPVNNRWLDESGYHHQEKGKLRFEGTYQSQMERTLDDLNIRFLSAPDDDPETEEDESETIPDPIVTGQIETVFTNRKDETFKTIDDPVHQRSRNMQEGHAMAVWHGSPSRDFSTRRVEPQ